MNQPYPGQKLHQIGPYIDKMRPELARELIKKYSNESDWIRDPFCGSGTIPFESQLLSRNTIASDINPYACLLTRAKLHSPSSKQTSISQLKVIAKEFETYQGGYIYDVPDWVIKFFHPRTLKEIIFFSSRFLDKKMYFQLGCLMGILHHQRPGFLSYPASHLVPYLRDKKFPRENFPEYYDYRNTCERIELKINRILKDPLPLRETSFKIMQKSAKQKYLPDNSIDAVITSPPYMNALDYSRDNRLRMWFLGINDYKSVKGEEIFKISTFIEDMELVLKAIADCMKDNSPCVLVLGDVHHEIKYDVPNMIINLVHEKIKDLTFVQESIDYLPDSRRSRREGKATRKESIIVFRRNKRIS